MAKEQAPVELSWMVRLPEGETTTWFFQEVEKRFNVKMVANGIDPNDAEKRDIMIAAGEHPTAFNVGGVRKNWEDGFSKALPVDMIRKYMPNYSKLLDERYPLGWLLDKNPENENEYIALQGISATVDDL